jgi:hypothetical protein
MQLRSKSSSESTSVSDGPNISPIVAVLATVRLINALSEERFPTKEQDCPQRLVPEDEFPLFTGLSSPFISDLSFLKPIT